MTNTHQRLHYLQNLLIEDPSDSFVKYAIAKEYEKMDDLETAVEKFESLKTDDPEYVGLYYHLAHIYVELDDLPKAIEVYNRGIVIAKKQNDLHALSELMNAKTNAEIEG